MKGALCVRLVYCVEDDAGIRELIGCALGTADFEVEGFEGYEAFYDALKKKVPDLILLDIMLPLKDGMAILRELKHSDMYSDVPVIMLTAKSMETDKVRGLEAGADDYITKPFGVLELLARVKAVLRRSQTAAEGSIRRWGSLVLDYDRRTLKYGDRPVELTFKEFELLNYMMMNKGIVLSRDKILQNVWGYDYEGESRTVDMHVKTIRQKLVAGGCPDPIGTVRSAGYRFEGQSE